VSTNLTAVIIKTAGIATFKYLIDLGTPLVLEMSPIGATYFFGSTKKRVRMKVSKIMFISGPEKENDFYGC
jgi:hypothetical protein